MSPLHTRSTSTDTRSATSPSEDRVEGRGCKEEPPPMDCNRLSCKKEKHHCQVLLTCLNLHCDCTLCWVVALNLTDGWDDTKLVARLQHVVADSGIHLQDLTERHVEPACKQVEVIAGHDPVNDSHVDGKRLVQTSIRVRHVLQPHRVRHPQVRYRRPVKCRDIAQALRWRDAVSASGRHEDEVQPVVILVDSIRYLLVGQKHCHCNLSPEI
mmetsp:Transcript_25344/g.83833  ORF Transcript_25344/g.83833 Transcript_25344/m.83833 type:complete len:212 (+) Transcript_25344:379-1014(+)